VVLLVGGVSSDQLIAHEALQRAHPSALRGQAFRTMNAVEGRERTSTLVSCLSLLISTRFDSSAQHLLSYKTYNTMPPDPRYSPAYLSAEQAAPVTSFVAAAPNSTYVLNEREKGVPVVSIGAAAAVWKAAADLGVCRSTCAGQPKEDKERAASR